MNMNWQPIETAPKTGTVLLAYKSKVRMGQWDEQKYHKRPKPFWRYIGPWGDTYARDNQPTHWMPLPEPPTV